MLTDVEYSALEDRRSRASGAYFAASQLLLIARPFLDAAALEEAQALVSSLRQEHEQTRAALATALAARSAHVRQQDAAARADFATTYEQQQRAIGLLQAA